MLKIDDNLLQQIGLGALPAEEKRNLLAHIYETLEMRVGMRLADQMTNEQLDEFEMYFEAKDDAGAFKWLESNFPNYKDIVNEEFEKLKAEVQQSAPQILGAAQANPANAQLNQVTPQVDPAMQQYQQPPAQQQPMPDQYAQAPAAQQPWPAAPADQQQYQQPPQQYQTQQYAPAPQQPDPYAGQPQQQADPYAQAQQQPSVQPWTPDPQQAGQTPVAQQPWQPPTDGQPQPPPAA